MFKTVSSFLILAALALAPQAKSEIVLSFYGGPQTAPHSRVSGTDPAGVGAFSFIAGWDGRSFSFPIHYGVRATWWKWEDWGISLDLNHNKIYANAATLAASGFSVLEFTDGLNTVTFNATRRWKRDGRKLTPYVAAGLGFAAPHVEVKTTAAAPLTFSYQVAGPAVALIAGAEYRIKPRLSAFAEYKFTYNVLNTSLVGGGTLSTNVITNAINIGLSLIF